MSRSSTVYVSNNPKPRHFLRIVALVLTITAVLFILLAVLSFRTANQIGLRDKKPLANFSANIMPDYQNISFRSLDETINLQGWFFPAKKTATATIVIIHSFDQNRLPFDADTAKLYERFVDEGFHILAFDLRNSGESSGDRQTFGYREWEDVLAAMDYAYRLSGLDSFILYGIGTGVTAALDAVSMIPEDDEARESLKEGTLIQQQLADIDFDPSAIKGYIFDTALSHGDDYISYLISREDPFLSSILKETTPFTVRMSSGLADNIFIVGQLSRINLPVMLIHQAEIDGIPNSVIDPVLSERLRLFPSKTGYYSSPSKVFLGAYAFDDAAYRSAVVDFLQEQYD